METLSPYEKGLDEIALYNCDALLMFLLPNKYRSRGILRGMLGYWVKIVAGSLKIAGYLIATYEDPMKMISEMIKNLKCVMIMLAVVNKRIRHR